LTANFDLAQPRAINSGTPASVAHGRRRWTSSCQWDSSFTGHFAIATAVHIPETYGGLPPATSRPGGLAPWQEKRATEMISASLPKN
jgi:hypothetical protein